MLCDDDYARISSVWCHVYAINDWQFKQLLANWTTAEILTISSKDTLKWMKTIHILGKILVNYISDRRAFQVLYLECKKITHSSITRKPADQFKNGQRFDWDFSPGQCIK
jgi:hypothetical protein